MAYSAKLWKLKGGLWRSALSWRFRIYRLSFLRTDPYLL